MKRFVLLDLIRSLAIIGVVFAHIAQTVQSPLGGPFGIKNFYYVTLGGVSVTIFIVLSGLVLELKYKHFNLHYLSFIRKRILRLYPTYILSLLIGIIIYIYLNQFELLPATYRSLSILDLLCSLTASYVFFGKWGGPFVSTSWFLGVIFSLYLFYPYIASKIRKYPHISITILLLISSLSRFALGKYDLLPHRPLDWFPLCRFFEFGLGIYLANFLREESLKVINDIPRIKDIIVFMSKISFPLFLVHRPILNMIRYTQIKYVEPTVWIPIFLMTSLLISWLFLKTDKKVQESFQLLFTRN